MATISIEFPALNEPQLQKLDGWLQEVLWETRLPQKSPPLENGLKRKFEIHRLKSLLSMDTGEFKMIQGVREVFEITSLKSSPSESTLAQRNCKIVLIGKDIKSLPWEKSLVEYLQ